MSFKHFNCFVCGNENLERIWTEPLDRDAKKVVGVDTISLVRCHQCGFVFANPRPDETSLRRYYSLITDVVWAASDGYHSRLPLFRQGIRHIERYLKKESPLLLDVGCWTGEFLRFARERGFQSFGVEVNKILATYARENYHLSIITGSIDKDSFPEKEFDVVTMWDVLEHTRDPRKTVMHAHTLLKDGGILGISVPNVTFQLARARISRPFRPDVAICGIAHLNQFSEKTLRALLKKCGFEIVHVGVAAPHLRRGKIGNSAKRIYTYLALLMLLTIRYNLSNELFVIARRPIAKDIYEAK